MNIIDTHCVLESRRGWAYRSGRRCGEEPELLECACACACYLSFALLLFVHISTLHFLDTLIGCNLCIAIIHKRPWIKQSVVPMR